jgi:outer membrane protein TolC
MLGLLVVGTPEVSSPSASAAVLTLDAAIKEAQAHNADLAQAREKLHQAKELSAKVLANYLPQVNISGAYTRNQYDASFSYPTGFFLRDMGKVDTSSVNGKAYDPNLGWPTSPPNTYNPPGTPSATVLFPTGSKEIVVQKKDQLGVRGELKQPIIIPALWPAFKIADLGEDLVSANVEHVRREVLFGVVQLYYGCVSLKEVIAIQERLLENNLGHERDAKVQVESNVAPKIVLLRAQIDRTSTEQELLNARASYASAKVALGALLDRQSDFDVVAPPDSEIREDAKQLEEQAELERPDILVARISSEMADRSAKAIRYEYAPNLIGTATYQIANLKGFIDSYYTWAVGVALSWNLWDGGLREIRQRENASKLAEANEALRSATVKARKDVRMAVLDLEKARSSRTKAEEKVKLARENMRLVTVAFQAGGTTQVEVSDANTALAAAELSLVTENLNSQLAVLKLAKAAGKFNPHP